MAPYASASDAENDRLPSLLDQLGAGEVDVIAFTSRQQVQRLSRLARSETRQVGLVEALGRTPLAAVGPVVSEALQERGVTPALAPKGSYFMKPLVPALEAELGSG